MIDREYINQLLAKLFPICRSLTGDGVRTSLNILREVIPDLNIRQYDCSTAVYDWVVPPEWNVSSAYVENALGERIIDFANHNLHLVSYSTPFRGTLTADELVKHIHSLPDRPQWIPYRTSYYTREWGFCCAHDLLTSDKFIGPFEVLVDTSFDTEGALVYGEALKPGRSKKEILLSTYCCHPSLANDNLSGLITATLLFAYISKFDTQFSYRLAIVPETIGALCFLAQHDDTSRIIGGSVLTTTAGPGRMSVKESFDSSHWSNRAAHMALSMATGSDYTTYPFVPDGSDERQYSTPAFRINTPSIHKDKYYEYDEYHTSADNLDFISAQYLLETLEVYKKWFHIVDSLCFPRRIQPAGEFQLGARGLYPNLGGTLNQKAHHENIGGSGDRRFSLGQPITITGQHLDCFHWLMHLSDGSLSNIQIADRCSLPINIVNESIELFTQKGLITS